MDVESTINVIDDREAAVDKSAAMITNLQKFMSTESLLVSVSSMEMTCGQGHEPVGSASDCKRCDPNHFKHLLNNSYCTPCPEESYSPEDKWNRAFSVEVCRCVNGRLPVGTVNVTSQASANESDVYWLGELVCSPIWQEQAQKLMTDVSIEVIASVIAVQVAAGVLASVSTSIVTTVGASSASSVSLSSSGRALSQSARGSLALVTQVQFLAMTGRVGGSKGSKTMRSFSKDFEWANYKLGISFFGPSRYVRPEILLVRQFEV
jgi:hypothetical protein